MRTQIIDLETKNIDKDKTIKIYSQKLKIFEENRLNSLDEKYFTTSAPIPHPSDSSQSSNCSCQIKSKISRNETNLRDLDLKITLELVDFRKKLEDIRNLLGSAGSTTSESPPSESGGGLGNIADTDTQENEADPGPTSSAEVPSLTFEISPTSDISIDATDDSEFDFSDVDLN